MTEERIDTSALLMRAYEGFNARDMDAVIGLMHPDVDWPNGWEGGRVHGHSGVRDYWARQWNAIDPHVEPLRIAPAEDGTTVVEVHQLVRDRAGTVVADQIVLHVYAIENGLIRRMDIRQPE